VPRLARFEFMNLPPRCTPRGRCAMSSAKYASMDGQEMLVNHTGAADRIGVLRIQRA
jgi:hypothetical protein